MKKLSVLFTAALLSFLTYQSAAAQDSQKCGDRAEALKILSEEYGESRKAFGLTSGGNLLEMFASNETGTWTVTITSARGPMCLVAAGNDFGMTPLSTVDNSDPT